MMQCESSVCDRRAIAKGMCGAHYKRASKGLPIDVPIQARAKTPMERIVAYVDVGHSGLSCWAWRGGHTADGYAAASGEYGHRLVYETLVGSVPEERILDHLCRNRGCVNPDHLEPVTHSENSLRGQTGRWRRTAT